MVFVIWVDTRTVYTGALSAIRVNTAGVMEQPCGWKRPKRFIFEHRISCKFVNCKNYQIRKSKVNTLSHKHKLPVFGKSHTEENLIERNGCTLSEIRIVDIDDLATDKDTYLTLHVY